MERDSRGSGAKYALNKPDMKLPSNCTTFMKNEENKTRLLQLIQQVIDEGKQQLGNRIVISPLNIIVKKFVHLSQP